MAVLAQSVEHQIVALGVTGSNPVDRPNNKRNRFTGDFFFLFFRNF